MVSHIANIIYSGKNSEVNKHQTSKFELTS